MKRFGMILAPMSIVVANWAPNVSDSDLSFEKLPSGIATPGRIAIWNPVRAGGASVAGARSAGPTGAGAACEGWTGWAGCTGGGSVGGGVVGVPGGGGLGG